MRVVVPWNPYSPNSRRAAVNILALLESGFFLAFSRAVGMRGYRSRMFGVIHQKDSKICFHHLMESLGKAS
jgi:hypothetical protein